MANTQKLEDLVTHIVRCYTATALGCIEFACYDKKEALFLAGVLFSQYDAGIFKVTVHQFKPEKEILRLS